MIRDYYTIPEIARKLRLALGTIQRWCRKGELPAIKEYGHWWVKEAELEEFLKERQDR